MACIVYRKNKKSGITYAYRQESYRDPISKKPRNKRTYLGRVDTETNTIIEKKKKVNEGAETIGCIHKEDEATKKMQKIIDSKDEQIHELVERIKKMERKMDSLQRLFERGLALANETTN